MNSLLATLLLSAAAASAAPVTTVVSRNAARGAAAELAKIATTYNVACDERECTIVWEPKSGAALPPKLKQAADGHARMRALARKWRDNALTAEEKDELIKLFIVAQLASE